MDTATTGVVGSIATIGYAIATLGPALGIGLLVAKTQESTARQPEVQGPLFRNMIIGTAFIEVLALLGLVAGLLF